MLPVYYQMPYPVYHQVVNMDPSPSFRWCPRKMPLNWNLIEEVDVDKIAQDMDVSSLEYLVQHIAFANISSADTQRFGNRGALKAFKLLQLGVEYLTHLKRPLPTQPDSGDLKKALSQSQRRVEELENLLYESELKRERASASVKIYKNRFEALQKQVNDEDDDEGEVKGIENRSVDPFASIQREVNDLRRVIDDRGKSLENRANQWHDKTNYNKRPADRTATAQQIEDLFKQPTLDKPGKSQFRRSMRSYQGSMPT